MKKTFLIACISTVLLFMCACGSATPENNTEITTTEVLSTENADDYKIAETPTEESSSFPSNGQKETQNEPIEEETPALTIAELTLDSEYTVEDDFVLTNLYTDILSDKSVADGWYYYYSRGTESTVPEIKWNPAEGMYTSCELIFDLQNLKDPMEKTFPERLSAYIVFQIDPQDVKECENADAYFAELTAMAGRNPDAEIFSCVPMQRNPGQLKTDGYETRSLDAILLEKDEIAQQYLVTDVSEAFYQSWEDSNATEPMWIVFSYNDDLVFTLNLREWLEESVE